MSLTDILKQRLESEFFIGFDIENLGPYKYSLCPSDSDDRLFSVIVSYSDTRIRINARPQKYSADFVRLLSSSSESRRKYFCEMWEEIGTRYVKVELNGGVVTEDDFVNYSGDWSTFEIKFNRAPFYDPDCENVDERVADYTKSICEMFMCLFPYEVQGNQDEGAMSRVTVTKYERLTLNRNICLRVHGYKCAVCGFDFEATYGEIGRHFIEVHHVKPVSQMDDVSSFDPVRDLVPLCSNCHSMAHKRFPLPYSVQELKDFIGSVENQWG